MIWETYCTLITSDNDHDEDGDGGDDGDDESTIEVFCKNS